MRPYIIGILLFLIWSTLSTWFYAHFLYPVRTQTEETVPFQESPVQSEPIPETTPLPEPPGDITLYFDYNKSDILSNTVLPEFARSSLAYLHADSASCLQITGYTCSIGTEAYNQELGQRRAEAVLSWFRKNGLTVECTHVMSRGEKDPAADNSTEAGRIKNRRVVVKIKPSN